MRYIKKNKQLQHILYYKIEHDYVNPYNASITYTIEVQYIPDDVTQPDSEVSPHHTVHSNLLITHSIIR